MMVKQIFKPRSTQRGAALAIGLVLLAVASMVTITSLNTGVMQERMAASQDNHARSFMAAEAGGARLVAWVNANGWPTTIPAPFTGVTRVVSTDPSITFRMTSSAWTASPLVVEVEGHARTPDGNTVLAQTRLRIELERTPGGGSTPPPTAAPRVNAPAAISCFGGPCGITAGAGRGADEGFGTVSGFNHPIPPLNCSGGGCRMQPQGADRTMPAVPAVFLTHSVGSSVGVQGGGNFNAFQGLNRAGTGVAIENDIDAARLPSNYPNNPDGTSTAPTWDSVFGAGTPPPQTSLESGRTTLTAIGGSNFEVGTLVVDGQDLTMQGNALFVGLIVIRNCGTLRMSGNPNVYGAVIVDARRANGTACPTNYDPFGGAGTPAVRYSLAALNRAANPPPPPGTGTGTGTGTGFSVLRWMEIIQ